MNDYLNLSKICRKLGEALSRECSPISASLLIELFEKQAAAWNCSELIRAESGDVLVRPTIVFAIYADWLADIGVALGFDCQAEESAGEWIKDDMVAVRSITKEIRTMAVGGLSGLDEKLKAEYGYSASDVFMKSVSSGEPMEQSHARLHAKHCGPKRVK